MISKHIFMDTQQLSEQRVLFLTIEFIVWSPNFEWLQVLLCITKDSTKYQSFVYIHLMDQTGGARGVIVIVVENGHGDTSSNPGQD